MSVLPEGAVAPSFHLGSAPGQGASLESFRGKNLVIAFYPADWSPVCGDELALFNEALDLIRGQDAEMVAISVDGVWCHAAFRENRGLAFPLLSDFEPKGAVSRAYGAYNGVEGVSERALFVLDGRGVIRWSHLSPPGVNPGVDGILLALESLAAEEVA